MSWNPSTKSFRLSILVCRGWFARRPRHRSPRTRARNVPPAPARSARHPAKHRPPADRQPRRMDAGQILSRRAGALAEADGNAAVVQKNKAGISGGQDGFQDEQTTKDRRGPSSVVFLTCEYPSQTGMAASSQKSSPTAPPRQIPHTPYFHRTLLPDTVSVRSTLPSPRPSSVPSSSPITASPWT
jgi:hypothetical protein